MSETASSANPSNSSDDAGAPPRSRDWLQASRQTRSPRRRTVMLASCATASLIGILTAIAALPERSATAKLITIYCPPPDAEASGVDAPHDPARDPLWGLQSINAPQPPALSSSPPAASAHATSGASTSGVSTSGASTSGAPTSRASTSDAPASAPRASATTDSASPDSTPAPAAGSEKTTGESASANTAPPATPSSPASTPHQAAATAGKATPAGSSSAPPAAHASAGKSWQEALQTVGRHDQLVVHLSAMARLSQGQLSFVGRDRLQRTARPIDLQDVLSQLAGHPCRTKVLVLDIFWPRASEDAAQTERRLREVETAIEAELGRQPDEHRAVLLAAGPRGPARAFPLQPQTLLNHFLTEALVGAQADTNRDRHLTIKEIVDWAGPRIAAASEALGEGTQRIRLLSGSTSLVLTPLPEPSSVAARSYPRWLRAAWEHRDRFFAESHWPWHDVQGEAWNRRLIALESRWRRGESPQPVRAACERLAADQRDQINQALSARCQQRPDSLRLAATRFSLANTVNPQQEAAALIAACQQIRQTAPQEKQAARLQQAITAYVARFQPAQTAQAIDALLRQFDRGARLDPHFLRLAQEVFKALQKVAPQRLDFPVLDFPVLDAITKLQNAEVTGETAGKILQLYHLQDRLGVSPQAVLFLRPRWRTTARQAMRAQRFVWNRGMTTDEAIGQSLQEAIFACQSTEAAEQTVRDALRRLQTINACYRADRRMDIAWQADHLGPLQQRCHTLLAALGRLRNSPSEAAAVRVSEIATVRQASQALHRQWQRVQRERLESLKAARVLPSAALSCCFSAAEREKLFRRLRHPDPEETLLTRRQPTIENPLSPRRRSSTAHLAPRPPAAAQAADPSEGLERLDQCLADLLADSEAAFDRWLQSWIGTMRQVAALPGYQRIAERLSISGDEAKLPVAIRGNLDQLSWEHPEATVRLHYQVDLPTAETISFRFLRPASDNLVVEPSAGKLRPDQSLAVRMRLRDQADASASTPPLTGVWLRLEEGPRQQLIPLAIPTQPSRPQVSIDFGPQVFLDGNRVTVPLWPGQTPQPWAWSLQGREPDLGPLIVTVAAADDPSKRWQSAPLKPLVGQPQPIRFPAAAAGEAKDAAPPNAAPMALSGSLLVKVSAAQGDACYGTWRIEPQLLDPRLALIPRDAHYHVDPAGQNRFTVRLDRAAVPSPASDKPTVPLDRFAPQLEIDLAQALPARFLGAEASHLRGTLPADQSSIELFAHNLRFREGGTAAAELPVVINGDPGYYSLAARFPARSGDVRLDWQLQPTLRIECPPAAYPGAALQASLIARNLRDDERLVVELLTGPPAGPTGDSAGSEQVAWQQTLETPREVVTEFTPAEGSDSLQILAQRQDWKLTIPTDRGTGTYRLRVRRLDRRRPSPGKPDPLSASQDLLIDGTSPEPLQVTATKTGQATILSIEVEPGPSGIRQLAVRPHQVTAKKPGPALPAQPEDPEVGRQWTLRWPASLPVPEQVDLILTTGAGKRCEAPAPVTLRTRPSAGLIQGRVWEGDRPQPALKVTLHNQQGSPVGQTQTAADGSFHLRVAPGRYQVSTRKPATQRQATASVTVTDQNTTATTLRLERQAG